MSERVIQPSDVDDVTFEMLVEGSRMTDDLEKRLLDECCKGLAPSHLCRCVVEAGASKLQRDALAAKDARIAELEKALKPFAALAMRYENPRWRTPDEKIFAYQLKTGDLRRARTALGGQHDQ